MSLAAAGGAHRRCFLPRFIQAAFYASSSLTKRVYKRKASPSPAASPPEADAPSSSSSEATEVLGTAAVREVDLRPPSAIPFQPKVSNVVKMVGRVGLPVNLEKLPDGKVAAVSVLVQDGAKGFPQFWIPIIFQGDLAKVAAGHLKEDELIYVHGQLSGYASPFEFNNCKANIQLLAQELFYVNSIDSRKDTRVSNDDEIFHSTENSKDSIELPKNFSAINEHEWDDRQTESSSRSTAEDIELTTGSGCLKFGISPGCSSPQKQSASNGKGIMSTNGVNLWEDLISNSQDWMDFRIEKKSGLKKANHPDFKHKLSKESLWLSSAPASTQVELENLVLSGSLTEKKRDSQQELWDDLIKNPSNWWDNRGNKRHPKVPDFKHKDTERVLWVDHSTPEGVLAKLPPQKSAGTLRNGASPSSIDKTELWKDLIKNPQNWWDNRSNKRNPKSPDFKHRTNGDQALWLSSTTPKWIIEKLPPVNL